MRNGTNASVAKAISQGSRRKSQASSGPSTTTPATAAPSSPASAGASEAASRTLPTPGVAEPGDPVPARAREQQDREPDARDRAGDLARARSLPHPHDGRRAPSGLAHHEAIRSRRRRRPEPQHLPAPLTVPVAEPPRVAPQRRLDVHLDPAAAADGDPLRSELDVADDHRDVLALRGGRLVAGEILGADREDVFACGKRLAVEPPVPLDLVARPGRVAEDDLPAVEVDERVRLLAERVPDRDRAAVALRGGRASGRLVRTAPPAAACRR